MDFKALRKEYETAGFNPEDLSDDPMVAFKSWFDEATQQSPGDWFEPNAMTLSTSDPAGRVSSRWVLLKGVDADGFRLYTNYDSDKGQQIAANPNVALSFHWPYLGRQLRIQGQAARTTQEDSEQYFHSRPRGSQIGAMVSRQSQIIQSRAELEQYRDSLEKKFDGQKIPLPDNWGGYKVTPDRFEFWQGRLDRLHDRVAYISDGAGKWTKARLSP
jgi:pyridoxamine 5'-phosphate oxidase